MKFVKRYQQGGPIDPGMEAGAPQEAPMEQGGMEEQLAQLAQQLVEMLMQQIGDPQAVAMVLQMAMEMLQGAAQQQPVFRRGGKLVKR